MRKVNLKDGTPAGQEYLCMRCSWGQCITGHRESDRLVICTNSQPNMVVPFAVLGCTSFHDKHRPNWDQMRKLAIDIQPVRVSTRTTGFSRAAEAGPITMPHRDEEDEEDQAAFVRWLVTSLTEKHPAGGGSRGYIW